MTDDQFKADLLKAVAQGSPGPKEPSIFELAMKMLSFVSTAMVIWVVTVVNATSTEVQSLTIKQDYTNEAIEKFETFTEAPRFTEADFISGLIPLRNQINSNTAEMNIRSELLKSIDNEIRSIQSRVQRLELKSGEGFK